MAEYIEVGKLKADISKAVTQYRHGDKPMPTIEEIIDAQPIIETEPVKHAYVIVDEDGNTECSNCGSSNCYDNYCGNCGAKLIGTRKDYEEYD